MLLMYVSFLFSQFSQTDKYYSEANSWRADQIRDGVAGKSKSLTPRDESASITAENAEGSAPATPDSPAPFTPSGLLVQGTE